MANSSVSPQAWPYAVALTGTLCALLAYVEYEKAGLTPTMGLYATAALVHAACTVIGFAFNFRLGNGGQAIIYAALGAANLVTVPAMATTGTTALPAAIVAAVGLLYLLLAFVAGAVWYRERKLDDVR